MYSQYQAYQNPSGGAGGVATPQVWNGSAWVPAAAAPSSAIPENPVITYTQYYHQWTAKAKEYEQQLTVLKQQSSSYNNNPNNQQQQLQQVQSLYDWAKYYADMSSRAAHHFHQNPQAQSAPFELPPAPTQQQVATTSTWSQHNNTQQQQQSYMSSQQTPQATVRPSLPQSQPQSSDGMKRYVDRCMSQCTTAEQKTNMTQSIQDLMTKLVQQGTLHSTQWDRLPVPPVLPAPVPPPPKQSYAQGIDPRKTSHANNINKYSNHGIQYNSTPQRKRHNNIQNQNNLPTNDSYYGPSAGDTTVTTPFSHTQTFSQQQLPQSNGHTGYYGPSSISSNNNNNTDTNDLGNFVPLSTNKSTNPKKLKRKHSSGFNQSTDALDDRAKRFAGPGGLRDVVASTRTVQGFDRFMGKSTIGGSSIKLNETDYEQMKVKGTCTVLEKEYLRLTAPPRAELVRPQPILEQHLQNLKTERQKDNRRDYLWFCSQLKAVRQDCTVQHLQNAFCVDVYETHARIALEEGDLNEYNQCQTQLKELYRHLSDKDPQAVVNRNEFVAYRLLYYVFLTGNQKYDGGSSDLLKILLALTPADRTDKAIHHALQVRVAVADMDYHAFFRIKQDCPNLGGLLMDLMVPGLRHNALLRIGKAYRPSVEIDFVLTELGFDITKDTEKEYGRKWLKSCGCILSEDGVSWNTKDSTVRESDLEDKTSSLI